MSLLVVSEDAGDKGRIAIFAAIQKTNENFILFIYFVASIGVNGFSSLRFFFPIKLK